MPATGAAKTRRASDRLAFLKNVAGAPRLTGAVAPSSPALARLMASFVDPDDDKPILELGPGTGAVTAALIERGIAPEKIVAIEFMADFCVLLRRRFDGIAVVEGDAYNLDATLPAAKSGPFAAVVSSLPLLTRPPATRLALVKQALDRMPAGAPFIQFSYSLLAPVKALAGGFTVKPSKWVVMNLPPARVWVYRRAG